MPACDGKRYWPHRHAAQAAARILKQTAYECPFCDGWHLTNMSAKESAAVRRRYEDRARHRSQEATNMGKNNVKLTLRVLQANPATAAETTDHDKDGNVTGITRQIYEDVRLAVTSVQTGSQEGGGRLVSGELVLSVPEGDLKIGQVLEADLTVKDDDAGAVVPTTAAEGSTLRQNREEAERGRKPDGSLGSAPKDKGGSRRSSARSSRRSGTKATKPSETEQSTAPGAAA